ncbi:MAG: beta-lactamase family protein [Sphingobacteriales bacterium]|jgi:CubicO group peptidase (beta-lactamase class C family)|nr:beta-lactamase family protein [Sphingobacteriales bacterium]
MIKGNKLYGGLLFFATISFFLSACQLGRFVFYNFADIKDYKIFESRPLKAAPIKYYFHTTEKGRVPSTITLKGKDYPYEKYLENNNTVAFLIIKNDTIQYEKYFVGYDKESIVPSFSMAKSVTSILIGCAIDDGIIKNIEEPITIYIPELRKSGFDKVSIKHLLQMTSGIAFNESYINPFGDAASFYYGLNLRKLINQMKIKKQPGKEFDYVSGNTQLLGLVLERALQDKTVTSYLQEKIWLPLGMEFDASWSIDRKVQGIEKTFCCLNARARDYAKIGRLYKNNGNWNGKQIVSETWVKESTKLDTTDGSASYYQHQWWLPNPGNDFMAEGILGQYIYVNPAKDLVIVRLGKDEGEADWWNLFTSLAAAY